MQTVFLVIQKRDSESYEPKFSKWAQLHLLIVIIAEEAMVTLDEIKRLICTVEINSE